jgi:hypothetical protein
VTAIDEAELGSTKLDRLEELHCLVGPCVVNAPDRYVDAFLLAAFRYFPALLAAARSLPAERRAREEVERERDGWVAASVRQNNRAQTAEYRATTAEAALAAERARVVALEEALAPFANASHAFAFAIAPDGHDDGLTIIASVAARPEREAALSTSDFRRARATLEEKNDG